MTDGHNQFISGAVDPSDIAKELAADGVDVFAVGIGNEINKAELQSLVSKPEHIFLASNTSSLMTDLTVDILKALKCEGMFVFYLFIYFFNFFYLVG